MKVEKSSGAVVFTRDGGQIKYVIVQSLSGAYGFPKGHIESGESETEAALREVREETGLRVDILPEFRMEDSYRFTINGKIILKHVVYFLAEYSEQELTRQEDEIKDVRLLSYENALSTLQFDGVRKILTAANKRITHNK